VYIRIIQQFLTWLTTKPGGSDGFERNQLSRTAVEAYLSDLEQRRTSISHRSWVKTVIGNFADWLIETYAPQQKNPTRGIYRPDQAIFAPRELSDDQRYILKGLVERDGKQRTAALFALGYWAGCRVSDTAWLKLENMTVGPKIGMIKVGYKGRK